MEDRTSQRPPTFTLAIRRADNEQFNEIVSTSYQYRSGLATEGWLVIKERQPPLSVLGCNFRFTHCTSDSKGLPRYTIVGDIRHKSSRDFTGGHLEISRNGYLGLYNISTSGQQWTVEFGDAIAVSESAQQWYRIRLKSVQGQQPRQRLSNGERYLNVYQGQPLSLIAAILAVS
ncbi:hypothetical protein DCO48_08495 [Pseudomonas sp. SDI]|uniref:hypothetical protein n=1 Tax=Pseudomonas sp. SDI TaxID=2170734 RepID=UPI000DE73154|nr:hypothetical protein [Pseudomonas sp. SDI]PWB33688.1 hypothetical protein DCO48_08495 [Pseudomonas sp. SDI]